MPTFRHGKGAYFSLGTNAVPATPVNLTSYLDNVDFPRSADEADVTVFGDTVKKFVAGIPDASVSLGGNWDATIDAQLSDLVGSTVTPNFEYGPEGNAAGRVKYSGTATVTGYSFGSPVGDKVAFTSDLRIASTITRGTF